MFSEGGTMNRDIFSGQWNEVKGKIKEKWGKLTDDDLTQIEGKRDRFLGVLQKRYGYAKDQAEKELKAWEETCETSDESCESCKYSKSKF